MEGSAMIRPLLTRALRLLTCAAIAVDCAHLWLAAKIQLARRWVVRRLCG